MTSKDQERHLFKEDLIPRVAELSGFSRRQARRGVNATCQALAEVLGEGHGVTLQELGRFRVATVKSYWKKNLQGQRVSQRLYYRIYFSPSAKVMAGLNKHLREGRKNAKGKNHT